MRLCGESIGLKGDGWNEDMLLDRKRSQISLVPGGMSDPVECDEYHARIRQHFLSPSIPVTPSRYFPYVTFPFIKYSINRPVLLVTIRDEYIGRVLLSGILE
jgi:hypothetical protein